MAKVMLIFEDGKDDQMISFYSDRDISLDADWSTLTQAEILAALAVQLLDQYVQDCGAQVQYENVKEADVNLN